MFYLGIDIAKFNHVASLIAEDGSILVKAIKFTNSNESLQKLIDSILIANFLSFNGIEQTSLPIDDLLALKNLTRYRRNLVDNISKAKTQVTGILDKAFPEYSDLFSDIFGEASKQIFNVFIKIFLSCLKYYFLIFKTFFKKDLTFYSWSFKYAYGREEY